MHRRYYGGTAADDDRHRGRTGVGWAGGIRGRNRDGVRPGRQRRRVQGIGVPHAGATRPPGISRAHIRPVDSVSRRAHRRSVHQHLYAADRGSHGRSVVDGPACDRRRARNGRTRGRHIDVHRRYYGGSGDGCKRDRSRLGTPVVRCRYHRSLSGRDRSRRGGEGACGGTARHRHRRGHGQRTGTAGEVDGGAAGGGGLIQSSRAGRRTTAAERCGVAGESG